MHRGLLFIAAVGALFGCKPRSDASDVQGHYENATSAELARQAGQQRVPPQYARTSSVLVSDKAFSEYGMWNLGKAVVDAGSRLVVLTNRGEFTVDAMARALRVPSSNLSQRILPVDAPTNSVWVRDYAPIAALDASRSVVWVDTNYYPDRPADDTIPTVLAEFTGKRRLSLPVYNEGGNFMTTGEHCFMTERVLQANTAKAMTNRPDEMVLSRADVEKAYKMGVGCPEVTIFPRMPYEGTGHIDMWAKLLGDNLVAVSEIDPFLAGPRPFGAGADEGPGNGGVKAAPQQVLDEIQRFLDDRAADFERAGIQVVRMPMPVPVELPPLDGAPTNTRARSSYLFRSYTNALIVNDTVIVPDYVRPEVGIKNAAYPDADARDLYKRTVEQLYASQGRTYLGAALPRLRTVWVEADKAIASGGAVHCVTMQVPKTGP